MRGTLVAVLNGAAVGAIAGSILVVGYHCYTGWRDGGSADPRCAMGTLTGYVEVRALSSDRTRPDRVSCQYRPDVGVP